MAAASFVLAFTAPDFAALAVAISTCLSTSSFFSSNAE
jgi:hypothetical protein